MAKKAAIKKAKVRSSSISEIKTAPKIYKKNDFQQKKYYKNHIKSYTNPIKSHKII